MFNYLVDSSNAKRLPEQWKPKLQNAFYQKQKASGYAVAKLDLLSNIEKIDGYQFGMADDDDALCAFAKARANQCFRIAGMFKDKNAALSEMEKLGLRYEIEKPQGRNVTPTGSIGRYTSQHWWRRNIRRTAARNVEAAAINIGMVSRVAGLYASDEAVKRRTQQRARNRRIMQSLEAENDLGQKYNMADLCDLGVANPKNRRMEIMTRIAGFDAIAQVQGHAAEFYTLTTPSKYHARHHITGKVQKNYNGATPAESQKYLVKVFSRIRAKLHRERIDVYGVRVAEPHHDGTPHWHLLLFCEAHHVTALRSIMKKYALAEDGNEDGANKHRFKAESIDRKKGTAAGYIAKYISKNIDGYGVGEDFEAIAGDDAATSSAKRVDAWAATWGIRQFQQLGGHSVTVWRELRRADIEAIENETFKAIAEAADVGAWDRYNVLNGGVLRSFYEYPRFSKKTGKPLKNGRKAIKNKFVTLHKLGAVDIETGEIRLNQYQEAAGDKVQGVQAAGEQIDTHLRVWVFKRVGATETPWSSVNNCTVKPQLAEFNDLEKKRLEKAFSNEINKRPFSPRLAKFNDQYDEVKGWISKPWIKQQEKTEKPAPKWPLENLLILKQELRP